MTGASRDHANGTCAAQGAAVAFARELVAAAGPLTPARAKALVFAASRLAAFAQQIGLELVAERVLCEATVERFVLEGCARFSPATRRTLRSNLRALARALERYPQPAPLGRERAKAPYSPAEIEGFLRLAAAPGSSQASCGTSAASTWRAARAGCW